MGDRQQVPGEGDLVKSRDYLKKVESIKPVIIIYLNKQMGSLHHWSPICCVVNINSYQNDRTIKNVEVKKGSPNKKEKVLTYKYFIYSGKSKERKNQNKTKCVVCFSSNLSLRGWNKRFSLCNMNVLWCSDFVTLRFP